MLLIRLTFNVEVRVSLIWVNNSLFYFSYCTSQQQLCLFRLLAFSSRQFYVSFAGRLYQVEYAMEAIGHAGTCLGILANDGVLLAAERRNIHKLLDEVFFSEKIYKLNE